MTSTDTAPRLRSTRSRSLMYPVVVLAVLTALVHLYLGVVMTRMLSDDPALVATSGGTAGVTMMAVLFYLSFVGYVVLTAALYAPALQRFHRLARWGLVVWALGNVVAYFVMAVGHYDAFGLVDKLLEIGLVALLLVEGRRAR